MMSLALLVAGTLLVTWLSPSAAMTLASEAETPVAEVCDGTCQFDFAWFCDDADWLAAYGRAPTAATPIAAVTAVVVVEAVAASAAGDRCDGAAPHVSDSGVDDPGWFDALGPAGAAERRACRLVGLVADGHHMHRRTLAPDPHPPRVA
ncbi:MAG: hypothetical protein EXQ93_04550 [Alphaproteobacteria bacterium]|nr:hypothetical protein [Alphaproteobacteria bacterium]